MRPGIVLFPDARGIGGHAVERARRLAAWVLRPSSLTSTAMAHQHEI
jgi:dienelactone hydrolase